VKEEIGTGGDAAMSRPIVYTLSNCPVCRKLKEDWKKQEKDFEERPTDKNPEFKKEALNYGDRVPIIVFSTGQVEIGYQNMPG
jgi:glutaredoxin